MATRSLTNNSGSLRKPPSGALREEDYRTFCAALESTQRGRDFLIEYARRNRNADTEMLLDSLDRIETMMRAEGAARDRLQDELRVLLIAIRLARPDINSATALTKAARLVDLLDMMERRIDAMVENKDLPPIAEEPLQSPAFALSALSVVPRPDEPELPIPSFASTLPPPPIALVQHVTIQELPKEELPKQAPPKPEAPKQEIVTQALAPEPAIQAVAKPEPTKPQVPQETAIEALARREAARQEAELQEAALQEAALKARRGLPAEPYALFSDEEAAAPANTPEEKWLPDFGADEAQIIHTQPVRSVAYMPEVAFAGAPVTAKKSAPAAVSPSPLAGEGGSRGALATREPGEGSVVVAAQDSSPASLTAFAQHPLPQGEREEEIAPAPKPEIARLRDHPLSAIMSLSEEERIALFT